MLKRTLLNNFWFHLIFFGDFMTKFMLNIILGVCLSISLVACSNEAGSEVIVSTTVSNPKSTVIVVGAGLAGLKTAFDLKQNGIDVIVLEAQSKVGGRLKTNRSLGIPFDEGASWIHGSSFENPITDIANVSGLNLFETKDQSVKVYDVSGEQYSFESLEKSEEYFEAVKDHVREKGKAEVPFKTVFDELNPQFVNDRVKDYMLSAYLEFNIGGDISKLSSSEFDSDEAFDGTEQLVINGYDTLADYFAQDLNVVTNAVVLEVNYRNEGVLVTLQDGRVFTGDTVVIAVPLGVLKQDKIKFIPELPNDKREAIQRMHMGNVNKFLVQWDESFWDDSVHYIGYTSNQKGRFNYFLNVNQFSQDANALMTFAFGDQADVSEGQSDDEIINEILVNLRSIYGASVPESKPKLLRTKWRSNPYSYGAYSFVGVGSSTEDFGIISQPVVSKIFFAGEHTSSEYRGTVHGAYLSGLRVAKEILNN